MMKNLILVIAALTATSSFAKGGRVCPGDPIAEEHYKGSAEYHLASVINKTLKLDTSDRNKMACIGAAQGDSSAGFYVSFPMKTFFASDDRTIYIFRNRVDLYPEKFSLEKPIVEQLQSIAEKIHEAESLRLQAEKQLEELAPRVVNP